MCWNQRLGLISQINDFGAPVTCWRQGNVTEISPGFDSAADASDLAGIATGRMQKTGGSEPASPRLSFA